MNFVRSIVIIAPMLMISGCASSDNGLCPPDGCDKALFDPALLGDWAFVPEGEADHRAGGILRVERLADGSKTYALSLLAPKGEGKPDPGPEKLAGNLVVIGDSRYLDCFVADPKKEADRGHFFSRLDRGPTTLTVSTMDTDYFETHPAALAHRKLTGGIFISGPIYVITATTPEIWTFLEQHPRDLQLWPEARQTKFRRL